MLHQGLVDAALGCSAAGHDWKSRSPASVDTSRKGEDFFQLKKSPRQLKKIPRTRLYL
jgi:hypothetical protein